MSRLERPLLWIAIVIVGLLIVRELATISTARPEHRPHTAPISGASISGTSGNAPQWLA